MPLSTVTVRSLRNQQSGLDLSIPNVKEIPGIILATTEYQVLVVSNLSFFKLPKHREADVVQFVIPKQFQDFENLRKGLVALYPGTVFPSLPSSILPSFLEANTSERTSELEEFLKFVAATPKLATSHVVLEFLGVNPLKAGKFTSSPKSEDGSTKRPSKVTSATSQLFENDNEELSDMFGIDAVKELQDEEDEGLYSLTNVKSSGKTETNTKLFEHSKIDAEGFGEDDDEEEEEEGVVVVPGAFGVRSEDDNAISVDTEDISDILEFEDDVSRLLKLEERVKSEKQSVKSSLGDRPIPSPPPPSTAPAAVKPLPAAKPLPLKKPPLPGKKPTLPPKPSALKKPPQETRGKGRKLSSGEEMLEAAGKSSSVVDLGMTDILRYINENAGREDDRETDLFS